MIVFQEKKMVNQKSRKICIDFLKNGTCRRNNCRFIHTRTWIHRKRSKYTKQVCYNYHENGFCNYGDKCKFIHNQRKMIIIFMNRLKIFRTFDLF